VGRRGDPGAARGRAGAARRRDPLPLHHPRPWLLEDSRPRGRRRRALADATDGSPLLLARRRPGPGQARARLDLGLRLAHRAPARLDRDSGLPGRRPGDRESPRRAGGGRAVELGAEARGGIRRRALPVAHDGECHAVVGGGVVGRDKGSGCAHGDHHHGWLATPSRRRGAGAREGIAAVACLRDAGTAAVDGPRAAGRTARPAPRGHLRPVVRERLDRGRGRVPLPGALDECFALAGPQPPDPHGRPRYVAGLDLGHVNDRSALAVAHRDGPHVVLDYMRTWEGSRRSPISFDDVENGIASAHDDYRFRLSADPWQALHVLQRLRTRGIRAREFNFSPSAKQRLASTLLQSVNDRTLRLYPVGGLREELLGLRVKQTSSGWTFDHEAGGHDDRAVALSLAIVAAWETPAGGEGIRMARSVGRSAFSGYPGVERQAHAAALDLDVRQGAPPQGAGASGIRGGSRAPDRQDHRGESGQ
jgi:hypothetical protein